ncbi:SUIS protein, partial [Neopipo cinnamomea]|nr:SUIS protein [Neopipo cinnamomea]
QRLCRSRGCCWSPHGHAGPPWCFFSTRHGYRVSRVRNTPDGLEVSLSRLPAPSLFGNDVGSVRLRVQFQTHNRLRLQFSDPKSRRFEVPHEHVGPFAGSASEPGYDVEI